jgi:hypothetical protein
MAFLDNSGDIILDAVLTDVGRKRMAQGDFKISKFAVGDDEIDYGLYNKNHPSGSAYYDLEILQTPVLEAFTQINANINYGLTSYSRQDLLYLPSIVQNQKTILNTAVATSSFGVVYLADDSVSDASGNPTSKLLATDLGSDTATLTNLGGGSSKVVLIETGIDSTELIGSAQNQANFLLSVGLTDNTFVVKYDQRFVGSVFGPSQGDTFSNATAGGTAQLNTSLIQSNGQVSNNSIENYADATVLGLLNRVYYSQDSNGNDSSLNYSSIEGPRGNFTAVNFAINPNIPQNDFIVYGKVAQTQGGATTYDYIDTTIYVQGASTNVTLQIPLRIIKLSS